MSLPHFCEALPLPRGRGTSSSVYQQIYDQLVIEELRAAVDAFNEGDAEPFLALIAEDSEWRGISRGRLWWKHAPS